jgi:Ca-activated chloride channel homolog
MKSLFRMCLSTIGMCTCLALVLSAAAGQSGRRKEKNPSPPVSKSRPGPIAEPTSSPPPSGKSSSSGKGSSDEVDPNDVVRITSNLVPIPASIFDLRGSAVTNLKLEDFELLVDGQLRPLSDLARSETSVRMAMLFDNSGSLDFAREFEKQAAMHFFRRVMRPIDEAAIYSIESESYLAQPLTRDVHKLEQTIQNFGKPEGSTSLFDAIVDAAGYLRPYAGRRILVIVSDGIETTSRTDFDTTMQKVLADDCQIFVVQTGLYQGANLRALAAERRMEQLSSQTGGAVYLPKSANELHDAFDQIAADLAQQYILSYYPAGDHTDGKFHALELRLKSRKDVRIRSRRGYYSPKPDSLRASGLENF